MPIDPTDAVLRGAFAQLHRANKSFSVFEVNKLLRQSNPGVYNATTAPQLAAVTKQLESGPFPTAGMREFSFEYWYNYFFKELPNAATDKPKYAAPVLNDDGSFRTEAQVANKKQLFDEMLALGFKKFRADDMLTADQLLQHATKTRENVLQQQGVSVLFRGDGRLPATIQMQGGTTPQSRIDSLRTERNMTADWHPFKTKDNSVWVRHGFNADNCLFSAVSITPQFEVATKFPLLDDLRGSNPGAIGHARVTVRMKPAVPAAIPAAAPGVAQKYLAAVRPPAEELRKMLLLATKTNIYCIRLRDAFNTQKYQFGRSEFPEYASEYVPWADHLLWFSVVRVHFSDVDGNCGHLVVITDHRWLHDQALIANALTTPQSFAILDGFRSDTVRRGSLIDGVGGFAYTPDGSPPPFDIVSIQDLFIPGRARQLAEPAVTAPPASLPKGVGKKNLVIPDAFKHPK